MNKKILTLLAISLAGTQAWAGNVSIPNTFTDGTTASADEVNANFDVVKTAVDDNDSRITTNTSDISTNIANITANTNAASVVVPQVVLKDANGVYVGRVIGMEHVSGPYVLTDLGYRALFYLARGRVEVSLLRDVYYESTDCLGAAYVGPGQGLLGTVFIPKVFSETAYDMGFVLYTAHDAQSVAINVNSQLNTDDLSNITCNSYPSPVSNTLYPAYPNDPNVTGIQNTAYPARMRIE